MKTQFFLATLLGALALAGIPAVSSQAAESSIRTCPLTFQLKALNRVGGLIRTTSAFGYPDKNWIITTAHSIRDAHRIIVVAADGTEQELRWVLAEDNRNDIVVLSGKRPSERLSSEITNFLEDIIADEQALYASRIAVHAWIPGLGLLPVNGTALGSRQMFNRNVLEIDIPLTPGMSGGAVVDQNCRLLGIISFGIEAGKKRSFATPAMALRDLYAKQMQLTLSDRSKQSITLAQF